MTTFHQEITHQMALDDEAYDYSFRPGDSGTSSSSRREQTYSKPIVNFAVHDPKEMLHRLTRTSTSTSTSTSTGTHTKPRKAPSEPPSLLEWDQGGSPTSVKDVPSLSEDDSTRFCIPVASILLVDAAFGVNADLYRDVLKLPRNAERRDIRTAYFRRGREVLLNSDAPPGTMGTGPAARAKTTPLAKLQFQAISIAFEILYDPLAKAEYDTHGLHRGTSKEKHKSVDNNHDNDRHDQAPSPRMGRSAIRIADADDAISQTSRSRRAKSIGSSIRKKNGDRTRSKSQNCVRWNEEVEEVMITDFHPNEHARCPIEKPTRRNSRRKGKPKGRVSLEELNATEVQEHLKNVTEEDEHIFDDTISFGEGSSSSTPSNENRNMSSGSDTKDSPAIHRNISAGRSILRNSNNNATADTSSQKFVLPEMTHVPETNGTKLDPKKKVVHTDSPTRNITVKKKKGRERFTFALKDENGNPIVASNNANTNDNTFITSMGDSISTLSSGGVSKKSGFGIDNGCNIKKPQMERLMCVQEDDLSAACDPLGFTENGSTDHSMVGSATQNSKTDPKKSPDPLQSPGTIKSKGPIMTPNTSKAFFASGTWEEFNAEENEAIKTGEANLTGEIDEDEYDDICERVQPTVQKQERGRSRTRDGDTLEATTTPLPAPASQANVDMFENFPVFLSAYLGSIMEDIEKSIASMGRSLTQCDSDVFQSACIEDKDLDAMLDVIQTEMPSTRNNGSPQNEVIDDT